jgi:hypothetical protein
MVLVNPSVIEEAVSRLQIAFADLQ